MIPLFKVRMQPGVSVRLEKVLYSGNITQGQQVEDFEEKLHSFLGIKEKRLITTNSATSALTLALRLVKDSTNKRVVLTPAITCAATTFAIKAAGLEPRWVDINPDTAGVCREDLKRKLTDEVATLMIVHWGGSPQNVDELRRFINDKVPIVEDAAHAFGAIVNQKYLGNHGTFCCFSFQAIKHLTTGDGGALVCPDQDSYKKAKLLRWYGIDRDNSSGFRCAQQIQDWGYKFHMNDIAAAIGLGNLEGLGGSITRHIRNATYFSTELKRVHGLTLLEQELDTSSVYWIYTIKAEDRDNLQRKLQEHGIQSSRVHERNDIYTCLSNITTHLPGTDELHRQMLAIPCGFWLTEAERDYIISAIKSGW